MPDTCLINILVSIPIKLDSVSAVNQYQRTWIRIRTSLRETTVTLVIFLFKNIVPSVECWGENKPHEKLLKPEPTFKQPLTSCFQLIKSQKTAAAQPFVSSIFPLKEDLLLHLGISPLPHIYLKHQCCVCFLLHWFTSLQCNSSNIIKEIYQSSVSTFRDSADLLTFNIQQQFVLSQPFKLHW